ncbi:hypothetical protein WJX84_006612 [Apatococcus fuscideae]|uniref:PPPDE domain-containing protein n=1 Tax=Apatococcus fuscideae TaxID=2026836 RepID=A0AAW1SXT1_9CHLO
MADDSYPVKLHVYDLSNGLARSLSMQLLGKQIDGVWHTAVVAHGIEHYYGGGLQQAVPSQTPFGQPVQVIKLGETQLPADLVQEFVQDQADTFTAFNYDLFHHNCNHYSNELSNFLVGHGIPDHITSLPQEVLATPFGQMIAPMLGGMQQQLGSVGQPPLGASATAAGSSASSSQSAASQASPHSAASGGGVSNATSATAREISAATATAVQDMGIPVRGTGAEQLRETAGVPSEAAALRSATGPKPSAPNSGVSQVAAENANSMDLGTSAIDQVAGAGTTANVAAGGVPQPAKSPSPAYNPLKKS